MEQAKKFLEFVVASLVEFPNDIHIDSQTDEMGVLLTLHVNKEDMGKIIGREGNTAKAVRTLLRVIGMKTNARINLKIAEPEGGLKAEVIRPIGKGYIGLDEALDKVN